MKTTRKLYLDKLRGIAVILVLFRHITLPETNNIFSDVITYLQQIGWIGVDLFFVLSGFLVSGLIIEEYKKNNHFNVKKFLIRRAFKIYPPFYCLIIITLLYSFIYKKQDVNITSLLAELFYFQNYIPGLWNHTWSLAVEEHFYILLPILFILTVNRQRNFRTLITVIALLIVIFNLIRIINANQIFQNENLIFYSHFRLDSLLFGVLIRIISSSRYECLIKNKNMILKFVYLGPVIILAFISSIPLYSILNFTLGYSLIYVCFGLMLLGLSLKDEIDVKNKSTWIATIGKYSYGIYLWHMPIKFWAINFFKLFIEANYLAEIVIYLTVSIAFGIIFSKNFEFPILKLRDKLFPNIS